ncbi:MAG: double zinc ribbon domain-containing protein [Eubacterium sp.]
MAIIKCPECGKEISDQAETCIHCGKQIKKENTIVCIECGTCLSVNDAVCPKCGCPVNSTIKNNKKKKPAKKIIIAGAAAILVCVVVILSVNLIQNSNPVKKYLALVNDDKKDEAVEVYEEKIKDDEELLKELSQQEKKNIDEIYTKYLNEKEDYDNTIKQLNKYLKYENSKTYADDIIKKVNNLKESRDIYQKAVNLEAQNDIEGAIGDYGEVIKEDPNYEEASKKVSKLSEDYKAQKVKSAEEYNKKKDYSKAIAEIEDAINIVGSTSELKKLKNTYEKNKSEMYVKVKVTNKTVTPQDSSNWIFYNYINFVFKLTNNCNKTIKGVEGTLIIYDLFDKEILRMGCDFTGNTIASGKTITVDNLSYQCNQFNEDDMKVYNTAFKDLKFKYEIESIVFSNGDKVKPD